MADVFIALRNFYGRCFHRPKKKHIAKFMFHCHSRERNSNMADAHIIALSKMQTHGRCSYHRPKQNMADVLCHRPK